MAINQSQVDHIISTASADDPEVQLQQLKEEVDLIKKSIKKLLIDIRDRMNELENPFIIGTATPNAPPAPAKSEAPAASAAPADANDAAAGMPAEAQVSAAQTAPAPGLLLQPPAGLSVEGIRQQLAADEHLLLSLQGPIGEVRKAEEPISEKLRLQKVHKLFEWTSRMVKKYGHDRLEIMIESYATMGYISQDACSQIREISRLMPESLGESHDIGPDEFVSELYGLNHILTPGDSSLDRDMIEVLMEHRQRSNRSKSPDSRKEDEAGEGWIDVLDRN